jgi:hypothetical protein
LIGSARHCRHHVAPRGASHATTADCQWQWLRTRSSSDVQYETTPPMGLAFIVHYASMLLCFCFVGPEWTQHVVGRAQFISMPQSCS